MCEEGWDTCMVERLKIMLYVSYYFLNNKKKGGRKKIKILHVVVGATKNSTNFSFA